MKHREDGPRFRPLRVIFAGPCFISRRETGSVISVNTVLCQPKHFFVLVGGVGTSSVFWSLPRGEAADWGLRLQAPTLDTMAHRIQTKNASGARPRAWSD